MTLLFIDGSFEMNTTFLNLVRGAGIIVAWHEPGIVTRQPACCQSSPPFSFLSKLPLQYLSLVGCSTMDSPLVAIVTGAVSLLLL